MKKIFLFRYINHLKSTMKNIYEIYWLNHFFLEKEFVHHLMVINLSRTNNRIMIKFLIDSIWKCLRFQTKAAMFFVHVAVLALEAVISRNKVTRIKLNSWLVAVTFKSSSTFFVLNSTHQSIIMYIFD